MQASRPLEEILANRAWTRRRDPFGHVVAEDVFVPEMAVEIDAAVREVLTRPTGLTHFGWYDAWNWSFEPGLEGPLSLFLRRDWHDLVAGAAGIEANGQVSGGIHNHKVGSVGGFVHNDYNPTWFPEDPPDATSVSLARSNLVQYMTGEQRDESITPHRSVRALALLYYTGNDAWQPGDGGETALYLRSSDAIERAAVRVPPRNNTLVMFECTPNSFHTFLSNVRIERNCVIMWLHRSYEAAVDHWGPNAFVGPVKTA